MLELRCSTTVDSSIPFPSRYDPYICATILVLLYKLPLSEEKMPECLLSGFRLFHRGFQVEVLRLMRRGCGVKFEVFDV
jgi:hypothetical protein